MHEGGYGQLCRLSSGSSNTHTLGVHTLVLLLLRVTTVGSGEQTSATAILQADQVFCVYDASNMIIGVLACSGEGSFALVVYSNDGALFGHSFFIVYHAVSGKYRLST